MIHSKVLRQFILGNLFLKSVIYSSSYSCFTNKLFIKVVVLTIPKFDYKILSYKSF
ncbi:hypothetical protein LEP1GSC132_1130 [Leptospira kirschneri str. 200803703]|nr:hypothetical protein LEP1GSC042_1852 [Leptospira kirschneri serovar Bim str. PUO 1247]EMN06838.1 hypothetical protein LEP1GSC046_2998 [Leptospira kirschneri serovar Bim str. 1051]EMO68744.1 hypothetical protein LEP1GSC132_1130 [Leptospira kirschneri str. 200803703]